MLKHAFLPLIALFFALTAVAGKIDTVSVDSPSMHRAVNCLVVVPEKYAAATAERFSVIYLLHGFGGNQRDWLGNVPELTTYADRYNVIIVCPDGQNSWYMDSPVKPTVRFETFMTAELLPFVDRQYRTLADRQHRAITGLSMGGHGALYLAMRHRDLYAQAGSLSGGVDFRPFPKNWELRDLLGDAEANPAIWTANTVNTAADAIQNGELRLLIDCGTDDFFTGVNRDLHHKLLQRNIGHDYVERPGGHTWDYWRGNVEYHLLFFRNGFPK